MANEIKLVDLARFYRKRKRTILFTFGLVFLSSIVVALVLPPIYESRVTILVESQEIPEEYVRSTTRPQIAERLDALERRIISYQRIVEIIQAYELYPQLGSYGAMVSKFRKDFTLETIEVESVDRTGRGYNATVAFFLAFEHKEPEKAKQVVDTLAELFVEEERQFRDARASTTTNFLEKEMNDLRRQVKENEERISQFRAENINQLPGSTGIFQQMVFRLEQDIERIDSTIRTLNQKNVFLKSQIANIDPLVAILTEEGKVAANPSNRLKLLRLQLIQMQANLSDRHPDIIRLRSEVEKLEAQVGGSDTTSEKINRLNILENEIAEARSKFGDRHPDVVRLNREADLLKRQIAQQETTASQTIGVEERSDNPEYMNLRAQIIVTASEIDALREQRMRATQQLADYQQRLEMAPFIDEQFNALTLDYENAKKKFDEVSNKLHKARIAQELDISEQGQRFRIDRPAILPDSPSKPKRALIVLLGFMFAIGLGLSLAAVFESLDSSVKTAEELENIFGVPVLATVSFFDSPKQKRIRRSKQLIMVTTAMVLLVVASLMIHRFVMPIGDLWDKFENRLVEIGVPIDKKS